MSAITDLDVLLSSIAPKLVPDRFAFLAVRSRDDLDALDPVCVFREAEAISVICSVERAEKAGMKVDRVYRQITLQVHSSLEAVGFLAAVAAALAAVGVPCNAVSAYYHDHIFVPEDKAEKAMEALSSIARTGRQNQS
jgi:hypothetical protein